MSRSVRALFAALLCAVMVSGCAGPNPGPGPDSAPGPLAPPAELVTAVDCLAPNLDLGFAIPQPPGTTLRPTDAPAHPDAPAAGSVPVGFEPLWVHRCSIDAEFNDERGTWSAVKLEKLTGDFAALLGALAQPDIEPRPDQMCTADMEMVPELWLETASGEVMRAAWPRDGCGKTRPATRDALKGFRIVETQVLPIALLESAEARDAGCALTASVPLDGELLGVQSPLARSAPGAALPETAATVCFYRVDETSDTGADGVDSFGELGDLGGVEVLTFITGSFERAGSLPADAAADLARAAVGSAPRAPDCLFSPTRIAVVTLPGAGDAGAGSPATGAAEVSPLTVELDGCARVITALGARFDAPPEVLAALARL